MRKHGLVAAVADCLQVTINSVKGRVSHVALSAMAVNFYRKLKKRYDHADYHFTTLPLAQNLLLDEPNATINGGVMKPVTAHDGKQLMYTMTSPPPNGQEVYNSIDK